jgi:hypothetical protein
LALLAGCSEPDRRVVGATADGRFTLSLRAEKNWVHPGESLPIRVRVEAVDGPPIPAMVDTLRLVGNNGSVYPQRITVLLGGAADSLGSTTPSAYDGWIYFTAATRLAEGLQGEVYASFMDALATLKIRIVPSPDTL